MQTITVDASGQTDAGGSYIEIDEDTFYGTLFIAKDRPAYTFDEATNINYMMGSGDDTLHVFANILSLPGYSLNVDAGSGTDYLIADFSGYPTFSGDITVTDHAVSSGSNLSLVNFEFYSLILGAGNDSVTLTNRVTDLDKIDAGAGTDSLSIDNSAHTLDVESAFHAMPEGAFYGTVGFPNGGLTYIWNFENLAYKMGSGNDTLYLGVPSSCTVTIDGGAGIDTLDGYLFGDATLTVTNSSVMGGTVTLSHFEIYRHLYLSSIDDSVTLSNRLGEEYLDGNYGNDTLVVDNASQSVGVSSDLHDNSDDIYTGFEGRLANGGGTGLVFRRFEHVTYRMGSGNDTMSVIAAAGMLAHDQSLTLDGGAGVDSLTLDMTALPSVTITCSDGVVALADSTFSHFEMLTLLLGDGGNSTTTGAEADQIMGGAGVDRIDGGAGNDSVTGGAGADIFVFSHGSGQDTVTDFSAEDLIDVSGITGFSGYIALEQVGADSLVRFSANDTLLLQNMAVANITAQNFRFADGPAPILGSDKGETLTGTPADDIINGLGGRDILYGLDGNDNLYGGAGADRMVGGTGNDTYYVDNAGDVVVELHGGGIDTVISSRVYTLGADVEKLTLTSTGNIAGTGNALNNVIIGNDGNNKLSGGAGADVLSGGLGNDNLDGGRGVDTMKGGLGDDHYYADLGDIVTEYSGQGNDTISSGSTFTLSQNVENLLLTGSANRFGSGNDQDNHITGNIGNNTLRGLGGNDIIDGGKGADTMFGGLGNDTFYADNIGDVVTEYTNQGTDSVFSSVSFVIAGGVENLTLTGIANLNGSGNNADNILTGNAGDNSLAGGKGHDVLTGGLGADTFVFGLSSGADTITDFSADQNDMIDLQAYHAQSNAIVTQVGNDTVIDLGTGNIITVTSAIVATVSLHLTW